MPYRDEYSDSFVSDVFGRVVIPIMANPTSGTSPETIRKRKLLMAMTALRTQLRRRKPTANENEVSVAPSGLVFDLSKRLTVRGVADRLGKLGFRHAFEVQRFARNRVGVFDDRSGKLMSEVGALVGDLLVLTGQCAPGLSPVRATLLFARKPPPRAFDLALGLSEQSRVFDNAAIRIGGETIKAHVDADCRFRLNRGLRQIGQTEFNDQRDIPLTGRLALERRALQRQINGLRLSDGDPADFRDIGATVFEFDALRNAKRLTRAMFPLEFGKACPFLKEIIERALAIGEGLLQQLRVDPF